MKVWIDAQLSPALAPWLTTTFGVAANALRDIGLRDATDKDIFIAAQQANQQAEIIVMTKDSDFVTLLNLYGPPPQILWITCGNTSNAYLRQVLLRTFPQAIALFQQGEKLVEIRGEYHL